MVHHLINPLWQSFLELNLYAKPSSDAQTLRKEHYATRLYISSLAIIILIIIIASASIARVINKTEYSPSHTRFSQLASKYPNTISCPCSKIGITYDAFVTAHVHFHQVCSSQFVQQIWIDMVYAQQNNLSSSTNNFFTTLSFFWQVIAGFCNVSNRTWTDIEAGFSGSYTFNPVAVTEQVIRTQVQATLSDGIFSARTMLNHNLLALRRIASANQLVSALATNYYLQYPPGNSSSSMHLEMSSRTYGNCSCLHSEGCPHPTTFNNTDGNLITIPGMISDCLIMDATLASTLECYYNQSCLSLLHQSLPIVIQPLVNTLNKYFTINSTVEMILNEIMIDEITTDIQFDLFYSQCNPAYCSYSYAHRLDALFVITTIIGIFGGLSFVLRLIAPFIATIILRWKNRGIPTNNMSNENPSRQRKLHVILNHLRLLPNYIRKTIINLNLFENEKPRTPTNIFREQLLTRLFLLLLIICSIAAGFYTFLAVQDQIVTVSHPSVAVYKQLYDEYSDTLQCSCSQLSVPYGNFLNATFVLHQVCSSNFVSSAWLNYLESFDPIFLPSWAPKDLTRDFRTTGNSYFQLLTTFCFLAKNHIEDAQRLFINTQFVNDHLPNPIFFNQQIQSIIDSYIENTNNDFRRTLDWTTSTFVSNYFLSGANTNFVITVGNNDTLIVNSAAYDLIISMTHDGVVSLGTCTCPREFTRCFGKNLLYTNGSTVYDYEQIFSEIPVGCTPINGFLKSTLAWWYNESYLHNIQATYSAVILSRPSPNISSLNTAIPTRFENNMLEDLAEEMFVETWMGNNDTHFDQFYSQCAPSSCSYTTVRRRDLLVVLLLLVSICSGLNRILRILVEGFGRLIFFLIDWWKNQNTQRAPSSITGRLKHLLVFIYKSIRNVNLYKTTSTDEIDLRQQRIYTRIYIILFISSLSVLLFYTAIIERSVTKKYTTPSIEDYEHLLDLYLDNLNCPCTRISIPHKEFVTELRVSAFHQACTTKVIQYVFGSGLGSYDGQNYDYSQDFRNFQEAFYTSLQELCALAQKSVDIDIVTFYDTTIFVNQLIPRSQFDDEMNVTLNRFKEKTPIEFARTLNLIRASIQGNALMAVFSTNWKLVIAEKGQEQSDSFRALPITYIDVKQNTSCSCATSQACTMPASLFSSNNTLYYTLSGIRLGCFTLETVLRSSISCFYSFLCLIYFLNAMGYQSLVAYVQASGGFVTLNASSTRFNINATIETLADEMFIESWTTNVSYERFFNSCAPAYCTYKVYYRFNALELLTTFLSVYVGLSLVIHIMVPFIVKLIKKFRNRFRVMPLQ